MANLTVTIPDTAVLRVRNAVAAIIGIPAPTTLAQVQDACRAYLRRICLETEGTKQALAVPTTAETNVAADFPS